MRVIKVAEMLNTTPDTVRFYTRKGYLHPVKSLENGYKDYRETDVQRLRFIINARQLGFTVTEIGDIIGESEKGKTPCPMVRSLLDKHFLETEQKFSEMVALRKRMKAAIKDWNGKPNKIPTGNMICHLIDDFQ